MTQIWKWTGPIALWAIVLVSVAHRPVLQAWQAGWIIPAGAANERTPLTVTETTRAAGKRLFDTRCARCHGPAGLGDGPDANAKYRHDMDLTNPADAAENPDGVVFYKIWNGHGSPKMPAFSDSLNKAQAWTIVAYVQTLRPKG